MRRLTAVLLCVCLLVVSGCAQVRRAVRTTEAGAMELPAQGDPGATVDPRLPAANNDFGFRLLRELPREGNTLVSPFSAESALAMTANGADDTVRVVMEKTLGIDAMGLPAANEAYADLLARLQTDQPKSTLTIANSLWTAEDVRIRQTFLDTDRDYYAAEAASIPFGTLEANERIDAWVNARTHGLITELYGKEVPIDKNAAVVLVNALYFKADWEQKFDPADTHPERFMLGGEDGFDVPMMRRTADFRYLADERFDAVRMPYEDGKRAMYVFVPRRPENADMVRAATFSELLDAFVSRLDGPTWEKWMGSFTETEVIVALPKMKLRSKSDLKPPLTKLGMGPAFEGGFGPMLETPIAGPVFISDVRQAVTVEVDESGTKAAAATGVTATMGASAVSERKPMVIADRPFFFAIRDEGSGVVLFAGAVRDPR